MATPFDQLIIQAQSPDNEVRKLAEERLLESCDADTSSSLRSLMAVAMDPSHPLSSRQFALLSMRKLVTFYWGPGFESFRNTARIDEETKEYLRECLLKLSLDDSADPKIKNSASYCVVQISAVDFPDQWPQLLTVLYDSISKRCSLGAMSLLNDIYNDVVSDAMFFEGGIGYETLSIIFELLVSPDSTLEAKIAATKLFNAALLQMSSVDSHSSSKRKKFVQQCIPRSLETMGQLLLAYPDECALISEVYDNLIMIKNEFPKKMFPIHTRKAFKLQVIRSLESLEVKYNQLLGQATEDSEEYRSFTEAVVAALEFLKAISDVEITSEGEEEQEQERATITKLLLSLCRLDPNTRESWLTDFNSFVSTETGIVATYTIRDQAADFLGSLVGTGTVSAYFRLFLHELSLYLQGGNDIVLESALYLLQCLMINYEDIEAANPSDLVSLVSSIFDYRSNDALLRARCILVIPKILDKFMDVIPEVKELVRTFLPRTLDLALSTVPNDDAESHLVMASALIAFTYYAYFAELLPVLGEEQCAVVQEKLLQLINVLSKESDEDAHGVLMEALSLVISCNSYPSPSSPAPSSTPPGLADLQRRNLQQEFHLILSISGRDPSNVQVEVESKECLGKLLKHVQTADYVVYAQVAFPLFVNVINGCGSTGYKYSPLFSLILELVTVFMRDKPVDGPLPKQVTDFLFVPLVTVLLESNEDEILQLATEAISYLVYNSDREVIQPHLEQLVNVLNRMLSPDCTDTANANIGTLILTLITKFTDELQNLIPMTLRAAIARLIQSQNISTQQNLVTLLCFLTCSDPQQTLDSLFELNGAEDLQTTESQDIVKLVLSKWFETFEVLRGEKRIKNNIVALSKLYFLNDARLANTIVDGDIIPYEGDLIITRSMAKQMPDRFTQVSAYTKIVKLFISELGFQNQQPDPEQLITSDMVPRSVIAENETQGNGEGEGEGEGDDDEWEDVEEVLDYEKLKEYIGDEAEEEDPAEYGEDDSDEITGLGDIKESISELLIDFFREVTSKNISNFEGIYATLTEAEKKILTEQLI